MMVLLTEAPDSGWGPACDASTNGKLIAAALAHLAALRTAPGCDPPDRRAAAGAPSDHIGNAGVVRRDGFDRRLQRSQAPGADAPTTRPDYGGTMVRFLLAMSIVLVSAAGCSSGSDASNACTNAFSDSAPRAGPPNGASPLDDAVRKCRDLAAWRDAWTQVPDAHPGLQDPLGYLGQRCAVENLAGTELCRDLAAAR